MTASCFRRHATPSRRPRSSEATLETKEKTLSLRLDQVVDQHDGKSETFKYSCDFNRTTRCSCATM